MEAHNFEIRYCNDEGEEISSEHFSSLNDVFLDLAAETVNFVIMGASIIQYGKDTLHLMEWSRDGLHHVDVDGATAIISSIPLMKPKRG